MVIFYLTCADDQEAQAISQALLEAKLIVCARRSPISSSYWWEGTIQHSDEVLLMMESLAECFDKIEATVTRLHSYKDYVLTMIPVSRTTLGVEKWLADTVAKP